MKDHNSVDMEPQFREWLTGMLGKNKVRLYTDNMIISYSHALRRTCYKIEPYIAGNLFLINTANEFSDIYEKVLGAFDFEQVDKESGGTFSLSLKLYKAFLLRDDKEALRIGEELKETASQIQAEALAPTPAGPVQPDHSEFFNNRPGDVLRGEIPSTRGKLNGNVTVLSDGSEDEFENEP